MLLMTPGPKDVSLKILPGAEVMLAPTTDWQASTRMIKSADLFPALVVERSLRPSMLTHAMLGEDVPSSGLKTAFLASEDRSRIYISRVSFILRQIVEVSRDSSLCLNNGGIQAGIVLLKGKEETVRGLHLTSCSGCNGVDRVIKRVPLPEAGIASKTNMNWCTRDVSQLPVELDREPGGSLVGEPYLRQAVQHAADHTRSPEANPELKGEVAIGEDRFRPFEGSLGSLEPPVNGSVFRPVVAKNRTQIVELGDNGKLPLCACVRHNKMWAFLMLGDYLCLESFGFGSPEFKQYSTLRGRDGHAKSLQDMQRSGNNRQSVLQLMLSVEDCLEECIISIPGAVLLAPLNINVMHGQGSEQCPYTWCDAAALADASLAVYAIRVLLVLQVVV